MLNERPSRLFIRVCELDMQAVKPGNVGFHGVGHGMCAEDFIRSAEACAPAICRPGISLGERIIAAVEATRTVVDRNTNLGIILLCAPPIQAVLATSDGGGFRRTLSSILSASTVEDAVLTYRAIRLATPGNMGKVAEADLADPPEISLREAMVLARKRDFVAAQYADGYRLLLDEVVPCLLEFQSKWGYATWSVVGAYLALLGKYPDSLVVRKHGIDVASRLSAEAASLYKSFADVDQPEKFRSRLLEFDYRLKHDGVNPGTTADLVIAGSFIAGLRTLDQAGGNPLSREGRFEGVLD